jgi:hypothetical protein
MTLVRTIPKFGGLPQLYSFFCAPCGLAETKEQENDTIDLDLLIIEKWMEQSHSVGATADTSN